MELRLNGYNTINNFINSYQEIIGAFVVLFVLIYIFFAQKYILKKYDNLKKYKLVMFVFLVMYLIVIFYKFLLGRSENVQKPNFDFLWSYQALFQGEIGMLSQIFLNIIAFIPIGAFICAAYSDKKKFFRISVSSFWGFAISLSIESLQLILRRGMFELDDIFNNSLGSLIGAVIVLIL